jgi:hypothetical protein
MLYMIIIKGSEQSEKTLRPEGNLMKAMDDFNDLLEASNVKVMAKGLHPTSEGYRIQYDITHKPSTPIKGPFEPSKDQIAGFFLIEVNSEEEALTWFKQVPDPIGYGSGLIELRKVY